MRITLRRYSTQPVQRLWTSNYYEQNFFEIEYPRDIQNCIGNSEDISSIGRLLLGHGNGMHLCTTALMFVLVLRHQWVLVGKGKVNKQERLCSAALLNCCFSEAAFEFA